MKLLTSNLKLSPVVILFNTHKVSSHIGAYILGTVNEDATILSCDYSLLPTFIRKAKDFTGELHVLGFSLDEATEKALEGKTSAYTNYIKRPLQSIWVKYNFLANQAIHCIDQMDFNRNECSTMDEYIFYGILQHTLAKVDDQVRDYGGVLNVSSLPDLVATGNAVRSFLSTQAHSYVNRAYYYVPKSSYRDLFVDNGLDICICNCTKGLTRFIDGSLPSKTMSIVYEDIILDDVEHRSWTISCEQGINLHASVNSKYTCIGNMRVIGFLTEYISPIELIDSIDWVKDNV